MLKQVRDIKAQGNIALAFVMVFILLLFVVNYFIRKTIDNNDTPVVQGPKSAEPVIAKQDTDAAMPSRPSEAGLAPSSIAVVPAKNVQAAASDREKEIIHEPSIKENILLQ